MLYLLLFALLAGCEIGATDALAVLEAWAPELACMVVLYGLGQAVKRVVPPADSGLAARLYWRTLPLHPVLAGVAIGWFAYGTMTKALTFGAAGVGSTHLRAAWRTWVKYREARHA